MPNGFTFDLGIFSLLGGLLNALRDFVIALLNLIQVVANFIWGVLVSLARWVVGFLGRVRDFFRSIWDNWLRNIVVQVIRFITWLHDKLRAILDPILRIIQRIREWLDWLRIHIIEPILNVIQHMRALLVVFRIFGLRFARRLDERLQRLEGKIAEPYLTVRSFLNMVSTVLNIVLDPELFIRRNTWLGSAIRWAGGLSRALHLSKERGLTISEEQEQARDRDQFKIAQTRAYWQAIQHAGPTHEDIARDAEIVHALAEATGLESNLFAPPLH